jgi:hypothetical protein
LLSKLFKFEFSTSFSVSVEGQEKCKLGCLKVPLHCIVCTYETPQTPGVHLVLFTGDTCLYEYPTDRKVLLSENCSAVSDQWSCGVSTGTLK